MNNEFYFHKIIKFTALRQSKKALLVEIHEVKSGSFYLLRRKYEDFLSPIQVWLPKTWFKKDMYGEIWIWEKGLMMNLQQLIEKRKLMIGEAMEEKKHIERLH